MVLLFVPKKLCQKTITKKNYERKRNQTAKYFYKVRHPLILGVDIRGRGTCRAKWYVVCAIAIAIRVCVDFFFKLNLLPHYSLCSQGDYKTICLLFIIGPRYNLSHEYLLVWLKNEEKVRKCYRKDTTVFISLTLVQWSEGFSLGVFSSF